MVVVGFAVEVVVVVGIEVVVVVEVEVVVSVREVMRVVVLVGDWFGFIEVVVLEEVVVCVVLLSPWDAKASFERTLASVGDFDLQLK